METNASYASTASKDFQAPNFENPPSIMTSAGVVQTSCPFSLPPFPIQLLTFQLQQQQQAGSNTSTPRGQQKKTSRFLLEIPQLSKPRPRPVTNTTPANQRAQVSITRPNIQQHTAPSVGNTNTNQRRVTQLQMPSLHTPSRPKLPTTSSCTIHHTTKASMSDPQSQNTPLTVSKPSLQVRMPAQVELPRSIAHQAMNKNTAQTQPGSNALQHVLQSQQQHTSSSPEMVGNEVASQQDGATDSDTPASNTSQEMQAVEKNNASKTPQDTPNMSSVDKESENHNSDQITEASRGEEWSVFNTTDVQIQQPLSSTTPTQQSTVASASAVSTITASTAANAVEMANPRITTYSDPTFTSFNQEPQQMDTTNSASNITSQDPAAAAGGVYSMYGAEIYQQPNQQMQMV